nr:unnamed protein product [Callosobruchus analis]
MGTPLWPICMQHAPGLCTRWRL